MPKISPLQAYEPQAWQGLTTKNHIGNIYAEEPQKATKLIKRIHQTNFGLDLDSYLDRFPIKYLDGDNDFTWELMGSGKKNVPIVEARIDGTAVSAGDEPGKNFSRFEIVFPEQWFSDEQVIVGEKLEEYPLKVVNDPIPDGTNWIYTVELMTGDSSLFVPVEELAARKRWSADFTPVEQTLSKKGSEITFVSPFEMRNAFTFLRKQHTTPGNVADRPVAFSLPDEKTGEVFTTWTQYEDYEFDRQFKEEKNKYLMFARTNKAGDGTYKNTGKSGNIIKMGAGIRQQMEASNTDFYNDFSIEYLLDVLVELSEGKLKQDDREFVLRTGERGAIQFHLAIENKSQLFQPLFNQDRMNKASKQYASGQYNPGVLNPLSYGGQFVEYLGPQGIKVNVAVDNLYDDRERNKIYHPDGGLAESRRYDILDVGTSDGEPNIQKVYQKGQEYIMGYEPGLRNPMELHGGSNVMSTSTDGYTQHRATMCGTIVHDPTRTAQLIPNILS